MYKLTCGYCNREFERQPKDMSTCKRRNHKHVFCSRDCFSMFFKKRIILKCKNCNKEIEVKLSEIKKSKSGNSFCGRSCAATYNSTHKTCGTRVSKLEKYLQQKLVELYPTLEFHFNKKDTINSELDIYIPSLKLAFELNGIFHYEPIYGQEKLAQIQNNDTRKFQACLEKSIELCIIDTSSIKNFKEHRGKEILDIVEQIIKKRRGNRVERSTKK